MRHISQIDSELKITKEKRFSYGRGSLLYTLGAFVSTVAIPVLPLIGPLLPVILLGVATYRFAGYAGSWGKVIDLNREKKQFFKSEKLREQRAAREALEKELRVRALYKQTTGKDYTPTPAEMESERVNRIKAGQEERPKSKLMERIRGRKKSRSPVLSELPTPKRATIAGLEKPDIQQTKTTKEAQHIIGEVLGNQNQKKENLLDRYKGGISDAEELPVKPILPARFTVSRNKDQANTFEVKTETHHNIRQKT